MEIELNCTDIIIIDYKLLKECLYYSRFLKRHKLNYKFYDSYGNYLKKVLSKRYRKFNVVLFSDTSIFNKEALENAIYDIRNMFYVDHNITIVGIDDFKDISERYLIRNYKTSNSIYPYLKYQHKYNKQHNFQTFSNCIEIDNIDNLDINESSIDLLMKLNSITQQINTDRILGDKISEIIKFK